MKQLQFDIITTIQGSGFIFNFAPDHIHQDLYQAIQPLITISRTQPHIERLINETTTI